MPENPVLDLALRLWPQARDSGTVDDPNDLDVLLSTQGQPGAPGHACGVRNTFAAFREADEAALTLPTGERAEGDEARFIAHLLVTRTLLAAGLHVDERVTRAMSDSYALSWTGAGGEYGQSPLALAVSLWLIALDPLSGSDRPLPIDWSPECYQDASRWDLEYRLFSHYDIRERGIDWAAYISHEPERREGVSLYTIVEPLLRMEQDPRVRLALAQYSAAADTATQGVPAVAMLERGRIAGLLQAFSATISRGAGGGRPRVE